MSLARYQFSVLDRAGNVVPSSSIEVRTEAPGQALAILYSDRAGTVALGNPFSADAEGFAAFHVAGGAYQVKATSGSFERTWRYVAIGTMSEVDSSNFPSTGKRSIEVDGNQFQLSGDVDAPGIDKLYGTNSSGVRAWRDSSATDIVGTSTFIISADASPSDFATIADAIDFLSGKAIKSGAVITLSVNSETNSTTSGDIANIPSELASRLKIVGAAPLSKTITNCFSIGGVAGAWDVTYTLNNVTSIAVNDYVKITGTVLPGDGMDWAFASAIYGESTGLTLGSATASGTTVTCSAPPQGKIIVGQIVHLKGQSRPVSAVSTSPNLTFTVTGAFDPTIAVGQAYWYVSDAKTGTISAAASTTISGSSTLFTAEVDVGSLIFADGRAFRVASIAGNVGLTVPFAVTIPAATKYSVRPLTELHEGGWLVTNVDVGNSRITVRNTCRYPYAPPRVGFTGGAADVFKTVLKQTSSGDGIVMNEGGNLQLLDNVAVVGSGAGTGINLQGVAENNVGGGITCGLNVLVSGWAVGVLAGNGCAAWMDYAVISNCVRGAYAFNNGQIGISWGVCSGCSDFGLFASQGHYELDGTHISGTGNVGLYLGSNASAHGDWHHVVGCGWDAVIDTSPEIPIYGGFCEGGAYVHGAPAKYLCNGLSGASIGKGSSCRLTGTIFAGNGLDGASGELAQCEMATSWSTGNGNPVNGGEGFRFSYCQADVNLSAFTGNVDRGLLVTSGNCQASKSLAYRNNTAGVLSLDGAYVDFAGGGALTNTLDLHAVDNAQIDATGYTNAGTFSPAINTFGNNFSLIRTGAFAQSASLGILSNTVPLNFGTLAIGASTSGTISVPGAAVGDAVAIGAPTNIPDGLVCTGHVSAPDQVTVRAVNASNGAGLDPPSGTYRAIVFKIT